MSDVYGKLAPLSLFELASTISLTQHLLAEQCSYAQRISLKDVRKLHTCQFGKCGQRVYGWRTVEKIPIKKIYTEYKMFVSVAYKLSAVS